LFSDRENKKGAKRQKPYVSNTAKGWPNPPHKSIGGQAMTPLKVAIFLALLLAAMVAFGFLF
jgi:hypothetical protein